jgi:mitogen-activated protein kinase kinase
MRPTPMILPETPPLNIRKVSHSSPPSELLPPPASSPGRSPAPSLSLQIPGAPRSRPTTPKLAKLSIPVPANDGEYRYYGGGPSGTLISSDGSQEGPTIRPPSTTRPENGTTISSRQEEPITTIRNVISGIRSSDNDDDESCMQEPILSDPWSDDVLEEICRLGEGAGGAVHKVEDKRTGKIMARKTITTREAPMKQLERELSIMSSAKHINIIHFYGAYMSPSSSEVKILMDFAEGGSLETIGKRIKERNAIVGERIVGHLAEGILQGLAYLHTKKTIHRDIKPSNILLSREGVVKLCDFGVSGKLDGSIASTFTGTSFYMAPERICGNEYTIRSDVWSTGISLLELVQNRFPFPNDLPPIELMIYITQSEPPQLEDEGGVVWSAEMKDFIKQTLTVDASSRPTPEDMLSHPWIMGIMRREVHMARWLRQVWDWKKTDKSKDESSQSRPGTANGHSRPPSSDSSA